MDQQSLHLSDAQIEQYGKTSETTGPEAGQQIETHLADCPACRDRVLVSQRVRFALMGDTPVKTAPLPDRPGRQCPSEDDLRNLAAGLCPRDQATKLTEHAAQCNHCGPVLRMYAEDFSEDLSKDDEAVVRKLKSSSAGWQKKLVSRVLPRSSGVPAKTSKRPFFSTWVLVPTTAFACAAIAFAVWYSQRETPEKVEKLLAQAYTENRTMEMRVPYAKHSDFRQLRSGAPESLLNSPPTVRRASNEIASQLEKDPADPKWLLLSARLDLIEWNYQPAISALDKIVDDRVIRSPEVLTTRALALYEKAEFEHDREVSGEVVDLLDRVLQKNPADPVTLFNHAVACEKILAYECAARDWTRLLEVERDSGWADEARQHLKRIQEKKTLQH